MLNLPKARDPVDALTYLKSFEWDDRKFSRGKSL